MTTRSRRVEAHSYVRRNPQSPSRRRIIHNEAGYGGWDVIDILSVTPCARMPRGMRTQEFIPNSLHEEWTTAWNVVRDLLINARTEEESEYASKWLLWLLHGLLHETMRCGKNGNMQFREMARRFSMWRQRDMRGIFKVWKLAALKAERRISKAKARQIRTDMGRIDRALRLLRKGTILRAGKTLESKGLGGQSDREVLK
jgi:hypothetical protein